MEIITTHINADFDCLGSMIGARKLYPNALMVFPGAQERGLREFFLRSAFYAYDFKRLKDIDLAAVTRLILVDVRQSERIGPFDEVARRPGVEIHIYDHHPEGEGDLRGTVEHVERVGSTVTVLTHIFMERQLRLTSEEATMMMLGLYEDTGSLLFNSTTEKDFQAAAFLLSQGAQLNTVQDFLTQELTPDQVALLHELIENRTVLTINGIDISVAHASSDRFVGDLAVLAHKLKDMENLNALLVVVRMEDRLFLVGRSRVPEVPMGDILHEFGGGGHPFAASGTIRSLTLVQFLERLPEVLQRHVQPHWEARHLMSAPVKTAQLSSPLHQVRELFTRYNLNAMPVVDQDRVVGIITRQVVDRAMHHGLSEVPAAEYMSQEFATVDPHTPLARLQDLVVDNNQRFVPVVDGGQLVGAITRTDLLRHLVSGGQAVHSLEGPPDVYRHGFFLKRRHIERLLREQLPERLQQLLRDMGAVGERLGVDVYAVGGFVRDLLLNQENLDVDIVVDGDGIALASEYVREHDCRIRTHEKFGTAVIIFPDGFKVDVASTRLEYYVEPGALPTVEQASIKIDLYRRDFTVNTLAIALNPPHFGELLDFFGAQRDLREKAIRVLHNLSFVEDPTRVFRAIRFEQRLGFTMGIHTEHLLSSAVGMGFLEKVGGGRIFNELVILLKEAAPLPALSRLAELDCVKFIHPQLQLSKRVCDLIREAPKAINWFELLYTDESFERWLVYLLCLTAELDLTAINELAARLCIPPKYLSLLVQERQEVFSAQQYLERRRYRNGTLPASDLYLCLEPFSTESLLFLMVLSRGEKVRRWISQYCTHLRHVRPLLSGNDLKSLGYAPGPIYKEILAVLLKARLNEKVVTRNDEIDLVRKRFPLESVPPRT